MSSGVCHGQAGLNTGCAARKLKLLVYILQHLNFSYRNVVTGRLGRVVMIGDLCNYTHSSEEGYNRSSIYSHQSSTARGAVMKSEGLPGCSIVG